MNLYVPQDSQAKTDQKFVEKYFGKDSRGGIALFSAGNVVTLSMFEQVCNIPCFLNHGLFLCLLYCLVMGFS